MSQSKKLPATIRERREELLRPSPYLGYARDRMGTFLVNREAYDVAEPFFRRAIYLNPFESRFKEHLAWCLYKLEKDDEACKIIEEALKQNPDSEKGRWIQSMIKKRICGTQQPDPDGEQPR